MPVRGKVRVRGKFRGEFRGSEEIRTSFRVMKMTRTILKIKVAISTQKDSVRGRRHLLYAGRKIVVFCLNTRNA